MKTATSVLFKLVWTEGSQRYEFDLTEGIFRAGRNPSNPIVINDPSVSFNHAELTVGPDAVRVRDLGSTNGTSVGDVPVLESEILPGQTLRLGTVSLELDLAMPELVAPPAAPLRVSTANPAGHPPVQEPPSNPGADEERVCSSCGAAWPKSQAKRLAASGSVLYFCPRCGHGVAGGRAVSGYQAPKISGSFVLELGRSFGFPFHGDGWLLLGAGTVFFLLLQTARRVALYGGPFGLAAALLLTIFGSGYLFAFLKDVVTSSADGNPALPKWPDITSLGSDILAPFFQMFVMIALCFGPVLTWLIFGPATGKLLGGFTLLALGLIYFPMSMVAVSMFDTLAAMNPLLIVTSILRILPHYSAACVVLALVFAARLLGIVLAERLPIPVLPSLISEFVAFYFLLVMMRILGVMYHYNKQKLKWF